MRILLLGARGQVGFELCRVLAPLGQLAAAVRAGARPGEHAIDLGDLVALRDGVRTLAPQVIVNAAAYTAVDAAETDVDAAERINAQAVEVLAEEAAALGATLVHYSTDYVFDGTGAPGSGEGAMQAYRETDPCRPLSVYGRSKRRGEQAVLSLAGKTPHLVLRTGWVYGGRGRNFALTMMRLAAGDGPIRVVADQFGTPTWSRLIAEVTGQLLVHLRARPPADAITTSGLYHLSAPDHTTWHGFARHVVARAAGAARAAAVQAITTAEYPVPAPRPAWSVLSASRLRESFGLQLPPWRSQFDAMFEARAEERAAPF